MSGETKLDCPFCGSAMVLRTSKYGKFWGCGSYPECRATVGAHPDGKPMGIPGDVETKALRIQAHKLFDEFWKSGGFKRGRVYLALAEVLDMKVEYCHFGEFDASMCREAIHAIKSGQVRKLLESK